MKPYCLRTIALLFFALSVFSMPQQAFAFCFAPQLRVSDEYFVSDLVFTGTVLSQKDEKDPSDPEYTTGTFYTVRVDKVWRGSPSHRITLYSENTTARFSMSIHQRYVMFVTRAEGRKWVVDNCGNSGIASKSAKTIANLRQLPLKQSYIYGYVYHFGGGSESTCEPMKLTVHSSDFSKTTDVHLNCAFQMDVPPGRYSAVLTWKDTVIPSNELNYKDIYCFDVPSGGSAGLAFREMTGSDEMNRKATAKIDDGYKARCTSGQDLRGPILIPTATETAQTPPHP
jgi:hypothetical protein